MNETISEQGVFPDFVEFKGGTWSRVGGRVLEAQYDGDMYYNSCRVPWRLAVAAIECKHNEASKLLAKFNSGIGKVGFNEYYPGYLFKTGLPISKDYKDESFRSPYMCSLYVNQRLEDFNFAYSKLSSGLANFYFQDSITILCLMLVKGKTLRF